MVDVYAVSVKHALCISSSFTGSGIEVFSQHGPNLLFEIKYTVLLQAKFWCGVNAVGHKTVIILKYYFQKHYF
uniref:Uncharacterized protein n=1 Tax=Piliocolobus tephrosceles TaxID=591936 RepID=A0A8C9IA36_9PRIM